MKLHWSPRSPFVRKVMVLAHEAGIADRIQLVRTVVAMTDPNVPLLDDNPLGKIPTLILEDGSALYDSSVICEFLAGERFFPAKADERWTALRRQALGDGFLDLLVLWRNEKNKPADRQTKALLEAFALKFDRTLLALEHEAPEVSKAPIDIGHITIACALSYIDFRFPELDWRKGHPAITAWHTGFAKRPSMRATEPSAKD